MGKFLFSKFAATFLRADIDELTEYLELVSNAIDTHASEQVSSITETADSISDPDVRDQYYEHQQDWHDTVTESFPRFFYYSFVGYVCAFIEKKLVEICDRCFRQSITAVEFNRKKHSGLVGSARKYLVAAGVSEQDPIWDEVDAAFKIRNKLIHSDGVITEPTVLKDFTQTISGFKGVSLETYQVTGHYRVKIDKEFVEALIDLADRFLRLLYRHI